MRADLVEVGGSSAGIFAGSLIELKFFATVGFSS